MADNNVIIIDETEEDAKNLSMEEIEDRQRKERLEKLKKTKFYVKIPYVLTISRITNIIGLLGIMFSMLIVNGTALVVSILILLVSTIVNYLFFK